jgi:ribulose-5-phosphate 4-epimerase/fuculose-1-phosphate aldolase
MTSAIALKPSRHNSRISDAEWQVRVDLAACYRLIALYGWDDIIFSHITARVPDSDHSFLINPYGQMFEEITASSLVRIDKDGNKIDDSPHEVNPAGFVVHSAVHLAREDAMCVIHLHSADGVAVSSMEEGLIPLNQRSMCSTGDIAYHEFEGPALRDDERVRMQQNLGTRNRMILRNHGTLALAPTVPEAFMRMYFLEMGCTAQVRAMSGKLHMPSAESRLRTEDAGTNPRSQHLFVDLAWPALLRKLDRRDPSYRN